MKTVAGDSPIAYEILAYLAAHPEAQDTVEGIVQWWLLEQHIQRQTVHVKAALAQLVAEGLVLERKGKDARVHYRVNQHKLDEIAVLLKRLSE
jgi:hypothetical protein